MCDNLVDTRDYRVKTFYENMLKATSLYLFHNEKNNSLQQTPNKSIRLNPSRPLHLRYVKAFIKPFEAS